MRNINNNSPSTFTLSSNNQHIKFNSSRIINFQESDNEIIKKYKDDNLIPLIFILEQNKNLHNKLKNRIEEEYNKKRNNYDSSTSSSFKSNDFKIKFFINSKNDICFILINKQTIYFSIFQFNKNNENNSKLIFDISHINRIYIKNCFIQNNNPDNFIYILLSNNMIIQIDYTKNCNENNNLIKKIFESKINYKSHSKKSKGEEITIKNFILTEYEYHKNKEKLSYFLYKFQNQTSNIIFCITFPNINENDEILFFSIYKNKYLVLALNRGIVRLISLETFKILSQYKSNFGEISSISFSFDGNLLGIGAQDNNGYIINLNSLNIISCLEGHENYISKMIFELQDLENHNNQNLSNNMINRTNSININKKTKFQKVDKEKILTYWKNTHNKDPNEKRNVYRKMSTMKRIIQNPLDKIYDIYTCGLDGKIGSYRIEYINTNNINGNNNNGHNISNNNDVDDGCVPTSRDNEEYIQNKNNIHHFSKKNYELKDFIYLNPPKNNDEYEKAHFDFMNPIINEPIIDFLKINLFSIIACKVNINGTEIKLILFDGENENENLNNNNIENKNLFNNKFNYKNNKIDYNNNNNNNNNTNNNSTRNFNSNLIFNKTNNNNETSISLIASQVDELNKTSVKPKEPK